jgi:mitochondrial fission protein ELM1
MKPLSVVAYFDGRPGHEKQTRGILHALSAMIQVEVDSIKVSVAPSAYVKNWAAYFFSFLLPRRSGSNPDPVDLIIGTGSHTHIPMLLTKKARSGRAGKQQRLVTCMTPDVLLRKKFDLCLVPVHDEPAAEDNIFITVGPPNTLSYEGKHQDNRGLILVGGVDVKSHIWKSEEVVAQVRIIIDRNPALYWTISSSPRTPENTCQALETMAASMQNVTFYRASETSSGWIEKQYALNRTVWVTADSISMVYEALTAGCSVGVLPVEWVHSDNKFNKSLNFLTRKEMIIAFDAWQQGASMPDRKDELLNESKRCAEEILRKWWPDRLE